jgi:hypothetical protein
MPNSEDYKLSAEECRQLAGQTTDQVSANLSDIVLSARRSTQVRTIRVALAAAPFAYLAGASVCLNPTYIEFAMPISTSKFVSNATK